MALMRKLTEANAAQREFAQVSARPAAHFAAVVFSHLELGRAIRFFNQAAFSHVVYAAIPSLRSGMPISAMNASASASLFALVTITMSIPRTMSILS